MLLSFSFLSPPAQALHYCQAICTIWSLSVSWWEDRGHMVTVKSAQYTEGNQQSGKKAWNKIDLGNPEGWVSEEGGTSEAGRAPEALGGLLISWPFALWAVLCEGREIPKEARIHTFSAVSCKENATWWACSGYFLEGRLLKFLKGHPYFQVAS